MKGPILTLMALFYGHVYVMDRHRGISIEVFYGEMIDKSFY